MLAAVITMALLSQNPWKRVMKDGTQITLYALTDISAQRSWSPDGRRLASCVLPPKQMGVHKAGRGVLTAFFRIKSASYQRPAAARVYLEGVSMFDAADLVPTPGQLNASIAFQDMEPRTDDETGTIRVGVALPPSVRQPVWPRHKSTPSQLRVRIKREKARNLASVELEDYYGLLADKWVDLEGASTDGRIIHGQRLHIDFGQGNSPWKFLFRSSNVERVFLVTRSFTWTKFEGVHLWPSREDHRPRALKTRSIHSRG